MTTQLRHSVKRRCPVRSWRSVSQLCCLPSCLLALLLVLTACYHRPSATSDAWIPTPEQQDSISFYTTHHYTQDYEFLVTADSLRLVRQQPAEVLNGMLVDTLSVGEGSHLVVADIMMMPTDTIDSVWVQVARDMETIGWVRESEMLTAVSPDNPISLFIDFFSDTHLLLMLAFVVLVGALYLIRRLYRKNAKVVHFNDIGSFYPALLALLVAATAVFYNTIQIVNPDSWRHYYYHPTLNPFAVPLHLGLFLASVWALVVVGMAALDDVRRHLSPSETFFYSLGLAAVCAVNYIVFSLTTLYHYLGYPLLVAYAVFAVYRYLRGSRARFHCGSCGEPMREKGLCPHCGAMNV